MTIEERLEKLERELARTKRHARWLLGGLGLCLGIGIVLWAYGQTSPISQVAGTRSREVRARQFILEDENGHTRAVLAVSKDGTALELLDENDTPRAQLMVIKEGPTLTLRDEKGRPRIQLACAVGRPGLSLFSEEGIPYAQLALSRNGWPGLTLYDEYNTPRAILGVSKEGPALALFDEKGNLIWSAKK